MSFLRIEKSRDFDLDIDDIASDKSISHRCAIFSLLSDKTSYIKNFLNAEDTINSLKIVENLGAKVEKEGDIIKITPPKEINEPKNILDCGNSGTAMRLFCGFLSSKKGFFVLHGDKYLANRPMKRVTQPLREIGAKIDGRSDANYSPLSIRGSQIVPFRYKSKIASAQVKSAMILSALKSDDISYYHEPHLSRDHTERMLIGMGVEIKKDKDGWLQIYPVKKLLSPLDIDVPSDPSSAFFFAVAAVISKKSKIVLKNVLLNPTRIEAFEILKKMGADIQYIIKSQKYETIGDIVVKSSDLKSVEISENIAWLIDELPAIAIAMSCAKGRSIVKNAKELRVKESDRIKTVVQNLKKCGIKVNEFEDGYEIFGGDIKEAEIDSYGDHRIAMSFAIAGLVDGMIVNDISCIKTSFPNFIDILKKITGVEIGD